MKIIRSCFRGAAFLVGAGTIVLAVVLLLYSAYMLLDSIYASQHAFSSREIQVYKPKEERDPQLNLKILQELNPDTTAWLTIYDTHIDYPVVQGEDDMEYVYKDVFGEQSLTGSIFLSSDNSRDYSDPYNLIYGHHISNGAMFGGIDQYAERSYFDSHLEGILFTSNGNYDIKIFAFMHTNAYDDMVYHVGKNRDVIPSVLSYIAENADNYIETDANRVQKILALSTCAEIRTNGRYLLFANCTPRTSPISDGEDDLSDIKKEVAQGHKQSSDHWAILNFACIIATLITLFPYIYTWKKFRQLSYARKKAKALEAECENGFLGDEAMAGMSNEPTTETEKKMKQQIAKDLRHFRIKMFAGLILEIIAVIAAVVVFVMTENLFSAIEIIDKWTWLMVLIFALALITDYICYRYRGKRPPEGFAGDMEVPLEEDDE